MTTTISTNTTVKTSISIDKDIWKKLQSAKNRSAVINTALAFYFDREGFLEEADNAYWENVQKNLKAGSGEHISLNPKGEEVSDDILEEKLWN